MSALDADLITTGDGAFPGFVSAGTVFDAPGQLRFEGGVLYGNLDADPASEFAIALPGVAAPNLLGIVP